MKKIFFVLLMSFLSTNLYANNNNVTIKKAIFVTAESSGGADSPAIKVGNLVFISAQGPLAGKDGRPLSNNSAEQIQQVFDHLRAVAKAAGGEIDNIVKLNVYLTSLSDYALLNKYMQVYFKKPFPTRTTIQVVGLPDGDKVEMDALMVV
jgi:reactive intermediate/imine deaminase